MSGIPLVIGRAGEIRCLYSEAIDLHTLGTLSIQRGSHVEPTPGGEWTADLSPCNGPLLGPFKTRSDALEAEIEWLQTHWLIPS